uniref:Uncharacterized protein n=1 Tax=Globodera rostochiensis TaxID=31243 RepID=A0A914HLT3_GLORO
MRIFLCQSTGLFSIFFLMGLRPIAAFGPSDFFAQLAKTDNESKLLSEINEKFSNGKEIDQKASERLAEYLLTKVGNVAFIQSVLEETRKYGEKLPKTSQLPNAFIIANTVLEQFELFCKEMTKSLENGAVSVKEDCLKLGPLVVFIGLLNPFVVHPGGFISRLDSFVKKNQNEIQSNKSLNNIFAVFFDRYKKEWEIIKGKVVKIMLKKIRKEIEEKVQKELVEYAEFFWNEIKKISTVVEVLGLKNCGSEFIPIRDKMPK